MTYGGFLLRHPLFWALLGGFFTGAAVAAITLLPSRARRPERAGQRKWTLTWLALTGAVASVAAGIVFPRDLSLIAVPSVWAALAGFVPATLGFRFPRAAGFPLFVIVGLASVLAAWAVRDFEPVRDQADLARLTVLGIRDEQLTVEVVRDHSDDPFGPVIEAVNGTGTAAPLTTTVETVELAEPLFLLGALRFARYTGIGVRDLQAPPPPLSWLERLGLAERSTASASFQRPNLLRTYVVVVPAVGSPRLVLE